MENSKPPLEGIINQDLPLQEIRITTKPTILRLNSTLTLHWGNGDPQEGHQSATNEHRGEAPALAASPSSRSHLATH